MTATGHPIFPVCHDWAASQGTRVCSKGALCLLFHPAPEACAAWFAPGKGRAPPSTSPTAPQSLYWQCGGGGFLEYAPGSQSSPYPLPPPAPFVTVLWDLKNAALPEPRSAPGAPSGSVVVETLRGMLRTSVGVPAQAIRVIGFHTPGGLAAADARDLASAGVTLMALEGGADDCLLSHPRARIIAEGAARRASAGEPGGAAAAAPSAGWMFLVTCHPSPVGVLEALSAGGGPPTGLLAGPLSDFSFSATAGLELSGPWDSVALHAIHSAGSVGLAHGE